MVTRILFVANWKMNPGSFREAKKLFDAIKKIAERSARISTTVAPPAIFMRELKHAYKGRRISFAAQNAHFETAGAYTGELSMQQVKDAGATFVLVGHAERRRAGETNDEVRQKVASALTRNITPVICIGEKTRSDSGEHFGIVKEQLQSAYTNVPQKKVAATIVAYEPVWAIGSETTMRPEDMHEMAIFIRKCIAEIYAPRSVHTFPAILYGGAINESNVSEMLARGDVSGFLVGRASVDTKQVSALIAALTKI